MVLTARAKASAARMDGVAPDGRSRSDLLASERLQVLRFAQDDKRGLNRKQRGEALSIECD
jgi:hypothetical protein